MRKYALVPPVVLVLSIFTSAAGFSKSSRQNFPHGQSDFYREDNALVDLEENCAGSGCQDDGCDCEEEKCEEEECEDDGCEGEDCDEEGEYSALGLEDDEESDWGEAAFFQNELWQAIFGFASGLAIWGVSTVAVVYGASGLVAWGMVDQNMGINISTAFFPLCCLGGSLLLLANFVAGPMGVAICGAFFDWSFVVSKFVLTLMSGVTAAVITAGCGILGLTFFQPSPWQGSAPFMLGGVWMGSAIVGIAASTVVSIVVEESEEEQENSEYLDYILPRDDPYPRRYQK